jgi:hypothetical protein
MPVAFQLPEAIEQRLRRELFDLDYVAKEAALVELYRQQKLTHYELATALGLDRFETDGLLKRRNVSEDLITAEELGAQLAVSRKLVSG